jgi:hypothetical protein
MSTRGVDVGICGPVNIVFKIIAFCNSKDYNRKANEEYEVLFHLRYSMVTGLPLVGVNSVTVAPV